MARKRAKLTDERIIKLYGELGGSIPKIAKRTGRIYMSIWLRVKKLGLR